MGPIPVAKWALLGLDLILLNLGFITLPYTQQVIDQKGRAAPSSVLVPYPELRPARWPTTEVKMYPGTRTLFSLVIVLLTAIAACPSTAALAADQATATVVRFDEGSKATVDLVGQGEASAASGTVKVKTKAGQSSLSVTIKDLPSPQTFGPFFTSYVLWSVLPEGPVVERLLSVPLKKAKNLEASIPSQRFALVVTAEPYPVVTQPSNRIAMLTSLSGKLAGIATKSEVPFDIDPGTLYAPEQISTVNHGNPPLPVLGARISVDLARRSDAGELAAPQLERAMAKLGELEAIWPGKPKSEKAWSALALETARLGHEARTLAERRAEEARVAAEEQARQQAIFASEAEAEQAKRAAEESKRAAEDAQREADSARLAEEETRRSVEQAKARLQASLSAIMSTRRDARGLVVNLSDVLFDFGKADLHADARESLAKVAGVLLGYPLPAQLTIEGHTDSIGSEESNMVLSQRRAEAVRDYLVKSGIGPDMIVATRGYGKSRPIASNDTDEGRSRNRRVEIIVDDDLSD